MRRSIARTNNQECKKIPGPRQDFIKKIVDFITALVILAASFELGGLVFRYQI